MIGLKAHSAQVAKDLQTLCIDIASVHACPEDGIHDVVIVGGGQSGMGAAFGLMRERVSSILILDENPAGSEGPWVTYARMITLRTPKELLSIDLGVPSLTFRSWWEAQYGEEGWAQLDKIPRQKWMEYLRWYREVLNLPIRNETKLLRIEPQHDNIHHLRVHHAGQDALIKARKVILATGIQGGGEWHVPDIIKESLPQTRYAHTSEAIDYAALAGKRVGILGGGASAFDNAQHALGLGVSAAHVFIRRKQLPKINPIRFLERFGLVPRFAAFDDPSKYRMMASFFAHNQPPTNDTFRRAAAWPGFALHLGAPWLSVEDTPDGVVVVTPKGRHMFDFLVLSTGLVTDPALRPELELIADKIAKWSDRYTPPEKERNILLDDHPYLGSGFEFTARKPADAASLYGLFAFNYSALISLGLSASALSGLRYAIPRLAECVANQLVLDNKERWINEFTRFNEAEFVSEWSPPVGAEVA